MRKKKSLFRRMAATGTALLFLVILALGAMRLPQVYGRYNDKRTLNHPEYTENVMEIHAYDYTSMEEKLQDMAFYQSRSIELQPVYMPVSGDMGDSDEALTAHLQKELDQLYGLGILYRGIDLSGFTLSYRELCNLYPGNGDRLRGRIGYWLLTYESEEGVLIAQLDTVYYKLYNISLNGTVASRQCYALGEYLTQEVQNRYRQGWEIALDLMSCLAEKFAAYYGVSVQEGESADTGGDVNLSQTDKNGKNENLSVQGEAHADLVEYLAGAVENIAMDFPDCSWKFDVGNRVVVREDGSCLAIQENYIYDSIYKDAAIFSTGIQWTE